jgi:hypothetical protein
VRIGNKTFHPGDRLGDCSGTVWVTVGEDGSLIPDPDPPAPAENAPPTSAVDTTATDAASFP